MSTYGRADAGSSTAAVLRAPASAAAELPICLLGRAHLELAVAALA